MNPTNSYMVPMVLERSSAGERSFDLYSRLLRDRVIFVSDEVNQSIATLICAQLLFLKSESNEPINMYVNSPGGCVISGLQIVDTMDYVMGKIKSKSADIPVDPLVIKTYVLGQAASMGSVIASSGTKGHRYMLRHARNLMHSVSSGARGTVIDMKVAMNESERLNELLTGIYVENTGQQYDKIKSDMSRDFFLDANQAVEYGLADEVIG